MSDFGYINDSIMRIYDTVDKTEYPETFDFILNFLNNNGLNLSPLDVAINLYDCDKQKNPDTDVQSLALRIYEQLADEGNEIALNNLGAMYYSGRGVMQDFSKAVNYYELAAMKGNLLASQNLGYCYYYGRNVQVDYEKAFGYFCLGAFSGMPTSLYKIGDMYKNGYFVTQNEKEAFRIYENCLNLINSDNEDEVAGPVYLRLGNCFLHGIGTDINAMNALICFQKAEIYLYNMVKNGDVMYQGSLDAAI